MKEIQIDTWLTLLGMVAAIIAFLWKGAAKVEKNDINLSHDVEKNKADIEKIDIRLVKIENTIIDKAISDALLNYQEYLNTLSDSKLLEFYKNLNCAKVHLNLFRALCHELAVRVG